MKTILVVPGIGVMALGALTVYLWSHGAPSKNELHQVAPRELTSTAGSTPQRDIQPRDLSSAPQRNEELETDSVVHKTSKGEPPQVAQAAKEERHLRVDELINSGPGGGQWLVALRDAPENWGRAVQAQGVKATFSPLRCYEGGCTTTTTFHAPEDLDTLTEAVTIGGAFEEWRGPKFRSGPIPTESGEFETTWVLYAPTEGDDKQQPG